MTSTQPPRLNRRGEAALIEVDAAQGEVIKCRRQLAAALTMRADAVREAREEGMTIYAIAKHLGVTQGAVRKMLDL